jgi:THO complex subunit 3
MQSAQKRLEVLRDHFRTHNKIKEQRYHNSKVHTVRWNCDGRKLASGSNDKTVSFIKICE